MQHQDIENNKIKQHMFTIDVNNLECRRENKIFLSRLNYTCKVLAVTYFCNTVLFFYYLYRKFSIDEDEKRIA